MTNTISPVAEDHFALEEIACRLGQAYAQAVTDGASGSDLANIINGLAGICFTQACTSALAWDKEVDEDGWSVSETNKLAGFLLLEVATCAEDPLGYRDLGPVTAFEDVLSDLEAVADAYASSNSDLIAQRLYEPGSAVGETTGSAAAESLLPLARAHGLALDGDES
jgi:hypothetical protein